MSAPEFRPGDRVRVRDFSTDPWVIGLVCEGPPVRPFVNTQPYGTHRFQETELVLRPVYPEPGQVAVLLDEEDVRAISCALTDAEALDGRSSMPSPEYFGRVRAILARARAC